MRKIKFCRAYKSENGNGIDWKEAEGYEVEARGMRFAIAKRETIRGTKWNITEVITGGAIDRYYPTRRAALGALYEALVNKSALRLIDEGIQEALCNGRCSPTATDEDIRRYDAARSEWRQAYDGQA